MAQRFTPGVFREDFHIESAVPLPTGVPGFVGFGQAMDEDGKATDEPVLLRRTDELARHWQPSLGSYLADVVAGFFINGGARCYVTGAAVRDKIKDVMERLAPLSDLDLVAVPDAALLPSAQAVRMQSEAIAHCSRHGNRFAILDAPAGMDPNDPAVNVATELAGWRRKLAPDDAQFANAALYYPWIKVPGIASGGRSVPPCGHMAGIYARSDQRIGVFKAPANEELIGVLDLEFMVDNSLQGVLNPNGINCLRALPGRGLRVWGARTLSADENWLYVSVRRLFLTLIRWADRNMGWATFEPNTVRLWNRIQRELNTFLGQLWQAGALKGASAGQAFYVKCDSETNPPDEREQGRVVTEIGLAPSLPSEFVVVRIIHRAGATQLG